MEVPAPLLCVALREELLRAGSAVYVSLVVKSLL